jgi:uncharacterized membrane protein HdeD (DUF308 family)
MPSWQMLMVRGAVAVVFGLVAMTWRMETAVLLVLVWGVWAVCDGVALLAQSLMGRVKDGRWWAVAVGVIAVVVGVLAVARPGLATVTLTWLLGAWAIVRGGVELVTALSVSGGHRWLLLAGGALSIVIGLLFVLNPGGAAVALAFLLGLLAVGWGVLYLVTALQLRRELRATGPAHPPLPA